MNAFIKLIVITLGDYLTDLVYVDYLRVLQLHRHREDDTCTWTDFCRAHNLQNSSIHLDDLLAEGRGHSESKKFPALIRLGNVLKQFAQKRIILITYEI